MRKIILISCVSKKLTHIAKAKVLYISPLFKLSLEYAYTLKPNKIFILSAKYGLVNIEKKVKPYEQTLNTMPDSEIKKWTKKVKGQLKEEIDFSNDKVIFLAGEKYRKYLLPLFQHATIPMKGLGIGKQLQYLKRKISHAKQL